MNLEMTESGGDDRSREQAVGMMGNYLDRRWAGARAVHRGGGYYVGGRMGIVGWMEIRDCRDESERSLLTKKSEEQVMRGTFTYNERMSHPVEQ